jgi:hypothetical protein
MQGTEQNLCQNNNPCFKSLKISVINESRELNKGIICNPRDSNAAMVAYFKKTLHRTRRNYNEKVQLLLRILKLK